MKRSRPWLTALLVIALLVGGYFAVVYFEYSKTLELELSVDPAISRVELFTVKDDVHPLYSLKVGRDQSRGTVTLRIYEELSNWFNPPRVQYYHFVINKDGTEYRSTEAFNLYNRGGKARLNIGMAGSWEIVQP